MVTRTPMDANMRLLEEQEAKLAVLRTALMEGESSGPSAPFDIQEFIAKKRGGILTAGAMPITPPPARAS